MVGNGCIVLAFVFMLYLFSHIVVAIEFEAEDSTYFPRYSCKKFTETEAGEIRWISVKKFNVELSFMTLEPKSLLLPLFLDTDFVFYVHTGKGRVGWVRANDLVERDLKEGDIYRIPSGYVFYIFNTHEYLKLRVFGIHDTSKSVTEGESQMFFVGGGHYPASILGGFDEEILGTAFEVPGEEIKELLSKQNSGPIVYMTHEQRSEKKSVGWMDTLQGAMMKWNKKNEEPFNLLEKKPDFQNDKGWSVIVGEKDYYPLKYPDIGVFMVNLTKGSMMAPHWNPQATEIGIVTKGEGMVLIGINNSTKSMRVKEGDVFVMPQFHPMSQISFGNESFEFMGFSTCARGNNPQFLVGVNSVLNLLDKDIVALAFRVSKHYLDELLAIQSDAVILSCPSCAEEEERKIEEGGEEETKREEKEIWKREEEEAAMKREEEEREERRKSKEEREEKRKEVEEREKEEATKRREEEEVKRIEEKERQKQAKAKDREELHKRKEEEREEEKGREEEERGEEGREEENQRREYERGKRKGVGRWMGEELMKRWIFIERRVRMGGKQQIGRK